MYVVRSTFDALKGSDDLARDAATLVNVDDVLVTTNK
jgi:hypothetical protein